MSMLLQIQASGAHYTDIDIDRVVPQARLDDLHIDSLTLAELMFCLEDSTGKDLESVQVLPVTVADLVKLLEDAPCRVN